MSNKMPHLSKLENLEYVNSETSYMCMQTDGSLQPTIRTIGYKQFVFRIIINIALEQESV